MVEPPDPRDVQEYARSAKPAFLTCRSYGHAPLPSSVIIVTLEGSRKQYYEQTLRCRNRCGVTWMLLIDMGTGEVLERRINYSGAKGYLAKGIGRIQGSARNVVRLEAIDRNFTEEL